MTRDDRIDRGREASFVLDNAAYKAAQEKLLNDIRSLRLSVAPRDQEGAYRLVLLEQAVEKAKRLLESYLEDAEAAKRELEKTELPGPLGRLNRRFQRIF